MAPRKTRKSTKKPRRKAGQGLLHLSLRAAGQLKKKLGLSSENKSFDTTGSVTLSQTATALINPAAGIARGTSGITRVGTQCRITHNSFKAHLHCSSAQVGGVICRIIWFLQPTVDTSASGQLGAADILQSATNIESPYNQNLTGCKILSDKKYIVCQGTTSMVVKTDFKWSPSEKDGIVQWTEADTTGAAVAIVKGLLSCLVYTDGAVNQPVIVFYNRVHFVDN